MPCDAGLLLFDGNPVRLTQIGFDLSRTPVGQNTQLRTFYRTTPRVAAIGLQGRPIALLADGVPGHRQQPGIHHPPALRRASWTSRRPPACLSTAPIAATGLGGYGIAQEPVAAAAFPDGAAFAVAHTDANGCSWLRVANLGCAHPAP